MIGLVSAGAALYLAALAFAIRGAAGAFRPWGQMQDGLIAVACLTLLLVAVVCVAIALEEGFARP
jgi:cell division protein FtsX